MKKKAKSPLRILILGSFLFAAGFFSHAVFFPYAFTGSLNIASQAKIEGAAVAKDENNPALTQVFYTDGQFSPRVVQVKKSYYVIIINASEKELMWLTSDNKLLTTPRGYGKAEGLRAQLYEPGVYTVSSSLHPSEKLQVIVK